MGSKVMVVDDDADIRETLASVLCHFGYDVTMAESGNAALALLSGDTIPDVMLLDRFMPDGSGDEVLDAIRGDARLETISTIVFSAGTLDDLPRGVRRLRKPCDIDDLLRIVRGA